MKYIVERRFSTITRYLVEAGTEGVAMQKFRAGEINETFTQSSDILNIMDESVFKEPSPNVKSESKVFAPSVEQK